MNVKFERVKLSGLMALAGFVVIGCGANSDAPAETNDPVFLQAVHDETAAQQDGASIARLVDQYLFHPASPEEMASIRTRVRELQGEELEQVYHTVLERSEATEGQRTLIEPKPLTGLQRAVSLGLQRNACESWGASNLRSSCCWGHLPPVCCWVHLRRCPRPGAIRDGYKPPAVRELRGDTHVPKMVTL